MVRNRPLLAAILLVTLITWAGTTFLDAQGKTADTAATEALATAVSANGDAVQAFATAVAANDAAVQAFATAVAPTPTVTPTVEPTATPTAEEIELSTVTSAPLAMVGAWWNWSTGPLDGYTMDIEIHNDIALAGDNGIYLIACQGSVGSTGYYFGLQTDVQDPNTFLGRGKGLIFSRWKTRDLENARVPDDGFTQSSGHEGDFIGVRRDYDWSDGQYRLRLAQDGDDDGVGRWYGLWITDLSTNVETWIGSLRFQHNAGNPQLVTPECYNAVEVYGRPIAPKDIPYWKVTLLPPTTNSQPATVTTITSSGLRDGVFRNSRAVEDENGAMVYEVGLDHIPDERK